MKPLRVIFFGTPKFAEYVLRKIDESVHQVIAVVTVPDKAGGRGQRIKNSPVKIYALDRKHSIYQPEKLRDNEFLKEIRKLNADVFVVVAFRMMPKVLYSIPEKGTFNLHASLLPDYRGAAPINYAIMNGEKETGVTTFFINEKIDEGNILLQKKVNILPEDDAGSLHDKLMRTGAELVIKTLDRLSSEDLEEVPQKNKENPKNAFKIFKEDMKIDWNQDAKKIYDFVRSLSPYPGAFTRIKVNGSVRLLKIYRGFIENAENISPPKSIDISKDYFKIYTKDACYIPQEVQIEGKKRMLVKDFLNGFKSFEGIEII